MSRADSSVYTAIRKEYPRTWHIWYRMNRRCEKPGPQESAYLDVVVCDEWNKEESGEYGFLNFFDHMGPSEKDLQIDRINPFGDYEPGNCRWVDRFVQNNNTRFHTTEKGQMIKTATKNGIKKDTYYSRCKRGWNPIDAATLPPSATKYKQRIV